MADLGHRGLDRTRPTRFLLHGACCHLFQFPRYTGIKPQKHTLDPILIHALADLNRLRSHVANNIIYSVQQQQQKSTSGRKEDHWTYSKHAYNIIQHGDSKSWLFVFNVFGKCYSAVVVPGVSLAHSLTLRDIYNAALHQQSYRVAIAGGHAPGLKRAPDNIGLSAGRQLHIVNMAVEIHSHCACMPPGKPVVRVLQADSGIG